jgi:tetraacyldisaccharide 4'-kinase
MKGAPETGAEGESIARWVERWWRGEAGWPGELLDLALAPAELAFRGIVRARGVAYDRGLLRTTEVPCPVISVGNISVGGAGKTPVTRWLVEEIRRRGIQPAVLHGGYAADEPELHRLWNPDVPVIMGRDRIETARAAVEGGARALVLDDGFQHRRLARDLDLVLVAAESWSPRARLLPRGPWREPASALARAQAVIVTRKSASEEVARNLLEELSTSAPGNTPIRIWLKPNGWSRPGGQSRDVAPQGGVVAVTAIAHPDLFVMNAMESGAEVERTLFFVDHHDYESVDLERIRDLAAGRPVVTTAKDMVKLRDLVDDLDLWILEQDVVVEEGADLLAGLLDTVLASERSVAS